MTVADVFPALAAVRRRAVLSDCGRYRYQLERRWSASPVMVMVGLNPSTADGTIDDATTRRVTGFARAGGCGGVRIVNVNGWRSTSPRALREASDPVGPDNDSWISRTVAAEDIGPVVAAWGAHVDPGRARQVLGLLRHHTVYCLGTTIQGEPRHPLYLPSDAPLTLFAAARHTWGPWTPVPTLPGVIKPQKGRVCGCGTAEVVAGDDTDDSDGQAGGRP